MATAAAVAAAIAALCCSIVPPLSKIRNLLRAAIGQPDALKLTKFHFINRLSFEMSHLIVFNYKKIIRVLIISRTQAVHFDFHCI